MPEDLMELASNFECEEHEHIVDDELNQIGEDRKFFSHFDELTKLLDELEEIQEECSNENWEGNNEKPISKGMSIKAQKLLTKLPADYELPHIAPTSLGMIEMEWYVKKGFRFAIRLDENGAFIYSGLLGSKPTPDGEMRKIKTYGDDVFTEDLPESIERHLKLLFPN